MRVEECVKKLKSKGIIDSREICWRYSVRHQCGQPSVNLRQVPGQSNGQWCEIGKRGK